MRFTPELLVGYARFRSPEYKCSNCVVSPGVPSAPPHKNVNAFHLGAVVKAYVQGHTFVAFQYSLYAGSGLHTPQRVALVLGYTFGGH